MGNFLPFILVCAFVIACAIVPYVFACLGLYTIAKRRGIRNAWLAWIPVGSEWIVGCIADQYQQRANGRNTNRRTALLVLAIAMASLFGLVLTLSVAEAVMEMAGAVDATAIGAFLLASLLYSGVSVAYAVIYYIALHNLYASCMPNVSTLFLLLSIFVSGLSPFLVFACRKKDGGMSATRLRFRADW